MLLIRNKARFMSVITTLAMLFSFANVSPAKAEGTPLPTDPSGWTQGSGVHFALPNSSYLPVTLDSSFPVTLTLSSVPEVVDLAISADPAIGSAEFTLSGFAPNTLYYHYADEGLNPVTFTTDANGSFTYTQDLSESHHVWFRDQHSTYFLYDNATGGDCASFGTWDWPTKTCTLTANVYQTIWFQANGITLDGNGFSSLYSDYYYAVYSYGYSNVTIKNLNISGSSYGIYVYYGNNITVTNNTVSGGYYGIIAQTGSNFTLTNNTITNPSYYGIYLWNANNGTIRGNTISNAYNIGVYIDGYLTSYDYWYYSYHYVGSVDYSSTNNTVYQNNFVNTGTPLYLSNWASPAYSYYFDYTYYYGVPYYGTVAYDTTGNVGNVFNLAAPDGGNYYGQFDQPAEGCNNTNSDSFCDSPFVGSGGAVDNLPWTTQDGWATPADAIAPTASPTQSPAANGAGWNNSDVTVAWNWTDNAGVSGIDNANCTTSTVSSGEGNITLNASCKDLASNTDTASYDVKVDKTNPAINASATKADTTAYTAGTWTNQTVTVHFTCSDTGGSGVASCPADAVFSSDGVTASVSGTATDNADNSAGASFGLIKIDKTLPTVSLVGGPANSGSYYFGSVPAAPTCSASDALSGLNGSCAVSGYSALVGSQTVTATANDNAGNQNSASSAYTVLAWTTNGFFQPVDMGGVWNTVKNGSTVPLKFEVFAGSTELTSTSIVNQPLTATQTLCTGGATDDIELLASGATSLRYDATAGQFIYNWQTPKKVGYCYVVTVKLADGSTISANFKLK